MKRSIGQRKSEGRFLGLRWVAVLSILFTAAPFLAIPAQAQESQQTTITGTVSSITGTTMLVKTTDGLFHLFNFDRNTTKPPKIPIGSEVRVVSYPSGSEGYRTAYVVTVLRPGPAVAGDNSAQPDVVPQEVRNLEQSIQRNAKKYRFGVSGGIALDPELVHIGLHTQFGPFFSRYLSFRPNVEFDWGEVTKMFGINAEVIYKVPISSRTNQWEMYVGGGPAFNFAEQSFGNRDVSFSDFRYDSALNILVGVQYRSGMFAEVKSSIYADPAPSFRLIFGYNF